MRQGLNSGSHSSGFETSLGLPEVLGPRKVPESRPKGRSLISHHKTTHLSLGQVSLSEGALCTLFPGLVALLTARPFPDQQEGRSTQGIKLFPRSWLFYSQTTAKTGQKLRAKDSH